MKMIVAVVLEADDIYICDRGKHIKTQQATNTNTNFVHKYRIEPKERQDISEAFGVGACQNI
jgi:hypothetical protein